MSKSQARLTYALLAVTVIIWGIQPLCIKWLVAVWTPVTITAMRYYLIGTARGCCRLKAAGCLCS